ncbi:MAG: helix-turn-helix domain-containing protein [Oscillospiraceae bacterium]|nr:helix-turn-helix domain-containing protein [Oscillospiraceae bacterium]
MLYSKRGYLNEDFRLFHLRDSRGLEFEYHYHEFDKIVVFLSGKASYVIEGASYDLRPWDVLLIGNHLIHRAVIDETAPYERVIIYINRDFVQKNSTDSTPLMRCFDDAAQSRLYLLRPKGAETAKLEQILKRLEEATDSDDFGSDVLGNAVFLQLLVLINRIANASAGEERSVLKYDSQIAGVINYVNDNLASELTVDDLAARSYLSKYYFMRRFKEMTGYTVHNYILLKRVLYAAELLGNGVSATRAAIMSGFGDYSTFSRAYKKIYGEPPKKSRRAP